MENNKTNETKNQSIIKVKETTSSFVAKIKDSITPENVIGVLSVIGGTVYLIVNSVMEHGYKCTIRKGDFTIDLSPSMDQPYSRELVVDEPVTAYNEVAS